MWSCHADCFKPVKQSRWLEYHVIMRTDGLGMIQRGILRHQNMIVYGSTNSNRGLSETNITK